MFFFFKERKKEKTLHTKIDEAEIITTELNFIDPVCWHGGTNQSTNNFIGLFITGYNII